MPPFIMAHHVTPEEFPAPEAAPPLWTSYRVAVAAAATSRTVVQSVMMMVRTARRRRANRHAVTQYTKSQQRDQSGRWTRGRKNFMLVPRNSKCWQQCRDPTKKEGWGEMEGVVRDAGRQEQDRQTRFCRSRLHIA